MAKGTDELVPVGRVFEIFPGRYDGGYIGIEVDQAAFCSGQKLIFMSPENTVSTVKVSTIEIQKQRTNVATPGDKCAIKPANRPKPDIQVGMAVFTTPNQATATEHISQVFHSRPVRPQETHRTRSPYLARTNQM